VARGLNFTANPARGPARRSGWLARAVRGDYIASRPDRNTVVAVHPMSNPYQPSQMPPQLPPPPAESDATGGVIPYKNMPALLAYYLGILSLICCLFAVPFGIVPLVLGIVGLKRRAANPAIHGTAHAWIGIILGALNLVACLLIIVLFVIAAVTK
jgi:hypothetical protein